MLREQLSTMNPYKFEHLVGQLLEAMGYEQVEVTKPLVTRRVCHR